MKQNKLLLNLLTVTLFIGLTSFTNDNKYSIVGTWAYTKTKTVIEAADKDMEEITRDLTKNNKGATQTITFRQDGTFTAKSSIELRGTYTYEDNILTMNYEDGQTNSLRVTVEKKTLVMENDRTSFYQESSPESGFTKMIYLINYKRK